MVLSLYSFSMRAVKPLITAYLKRRQRAGKESSSRFDERLGVSQCPRPKGRLLWVHAASVGEVQSALILIHKLLALYEGVQVLVTTGTRSSAKMMETALPEGAFHQYYPVDHPEWVEAFLSHWSPDLILWMESELWPNMLLAIQAREIPAILINARLSPRSFRIWNLFKSASRKVLRSFTLILCQTDKDETFYRRLGAQNVEVSDNLKYSAAPLPCDEAALKTINGAFINRPCWVYASSHAGEEKMAVQIHARLKNSIPDLLTVIVPRHPERRTAIAQELDGLGLNIVFRGEDKILPGDDTDIYIADTMGELGLFYRACPVAVIGRSFSDDGGGGHNPIEAAQLHCAVMHGPHVQNLQEIFDEMDVAGAALRLDTSESLESHLHDLLTSAEKIEALQQKAYDFARRKEQVLETVLEALHPTLDTLEIGRKAA
ncbi:MAG: 3-deoxy-D-manno-octulosonic acid transferase [Alphaproteobacteria bacterium]|nr:3-deoxy-D-manno-octulosonic acid transferase [Alphaproteobacteria bacterium]